MYMVHTGPHCVPFIFITFPQMPLASLSFFTSTHTHHIQTASHAVPILCHPSLIMQLNQTYKLWFTEMEGYLPCRWSHTQSERPVSIDPLWPSPLPLQRFAHLKTHFSPLWQDSRGLRGERVCEVWSDRATFSPIKSMSFQEHTKGTL